MLKHKIIIDRLNESQKISILADVRVLSEEEYSRLGIPAFKALGIDKYGEESYISPTSAANSWSTRAISELASEMAVGMSAEAVNVAYIPSPIPKLNVCDLALTEDPYLSAKIASEYLYAIGKTGMGVVLDGALLDKEDVSRLDKNADSKLINEFVVRALRNAAANKKLNGVVVGSDIDVEGYDSVNTEITRLISNANGFAFGNAYMLCKNISEDETVSRIVKGHICLDGSETVLKNALDRYKRLKASINEGKVSVCELEAEIENGSAFPPEKIDEALDRVLEFVFECAKENKGRLTSYTMRSAVVKNAASEATVLLKNKNNILPFRNAPSVAIVGDILINYNLSESENSTRIGEFSQYLQSQGCGVQGFYRGYSINEDRSQELLSEALDALAGVKTVLLFMGMNSEGDKKAGRTKNLCLPANQLALLDELHKSEKKIIAVVSSDISFDVSFADRVDALLLAPLNTKYGAEAVADIIMGRISPSGKLSRSLYKDTEKLKKKQRYYLSMPQSRVGTFVGYRYYDSADFDVAYPFGFGLSYSRFVYSNLSVQGTSVTFTVKNKGKMRASEVAQLYVGMKKSKQIRPKKELVGFEKITLEPNASATVTIPISNLEAFDAASGGWTFERGEYVVYVCSSARDVKLSSSIQLGNSQLEFTEDKALDYLQSETNIISDRYTLEADYKLMKKNVRNIIFGTGSLVLAVAMFLFSLISGRVGIFFNVVAAILAVAGIIFFVLEGSDRKKLHQSEREQINAANKESFANAKSITGFSVNAVFANEFDRMGKESVSVKTPVQARAEDYLEYVNEDLTFELATEQFVAFAASRGYKFELSTAREIFAAMAASRLIITKGMTNDSFTSFIKVLSEYFGSFAAIDAVDASYADDSCALFKPMGAARQKTNLANAIEQARGAKSRIQIAALTDVTFAEMSNYFVPFARYARNPRNSAVINAVDANNSPISINLSENLWIAINLKMGETLKNIPGYISELASVIKVEYTGAVPAILNSQILPFTYYQLDFILDKIKNKNGISEEKWKRIDSLETFIKGKASFAIGNRACIAVERFYAVFCACGGSADEALDRALSARIVPSAIVALNDLENVEDKNLSEKLEMIFGEEKIEISRAAIRASGSTVL